MWLLFTRHSSPLKQTSLPLLLPIQYAAKVLNTSLNKLPNHKPMKTEGWKSQIPLMNRNNNRKQTILITTKWKKRWNINYPWLRVLFAIKKGSTFMTEHNFLNAVIKHERFFKKNFRNNNFLSFRSISLANRG